MVAITVTPIGATEHMPWRYRVEDGPLAHRHYVPQYRCDLSGAGGAELVAIIALKSEGYDGRVTGVYWIESLDCYVVTVDLDAES